MMDIQEFLDVMNRGQEVVENSELHKMMTQLSSEAYQLTSLLNGSYNTPEMIRDLMSQITGRKIDESFRMFPPFYTDCGKNIKIGKNVFINSACQFQDQGGITIGDNVVIGPKCVIATLNHNEDPKKRGNIIPSPVHVGNNVWLGACVVIMPGITIGDGAIIGAGAVVTKDIPENAKAVGIPARVIGYVNT